MKRLLNYLSLVLILGWLTSCSGSSSDFCQYINNDQAVVSVDLLGVLENAGFTIEDGHIQVPTYISAIATSRSDREALEHLEKIQGIDPRRVMLAINMNGRGEPVLLAKITDKGKFTDYLEDEGFEKTNGGDYDAYQNDGVNFVIDGDMLLLFSLYHGSPSEFVNDLKDSAQSNPLASWKQSKLSSDDTGVVILDLSSLNLPARDLEQIESLGIDNIKEILQGSMVYNVELKGNKIKFKSAFYDADGDKIKSPFGEGSIDKGMVKYSNAEDFAVALFSMPDNNKWKEMIVNLVQKNAGYHDAAMIEQALNLINGKFMGSFGYNSIQSLIQRGDCHYAIAVQAERGKSHDLFDFVRNMLQQAGAPMTETGNALVVNIDPDVPTLYIVEDGNNVVFSSSINPTQGGSKFRSGDFDGTSGAFVAKIPSRSPNITYLSLSFGIDIEAEIDNDSSEIEIELTDCDGNFIENIAKTFINIR